MTEYQIDFLVDKFGPAWSDTFDYIVHRLWRTYPNDKEGVVKFTINAFINALWPYLRERKLEQWWSLTDEQKQECMAIALRL